MTSVLARSPRICRLSSIRLLQANLASRRYLQLAQIPEGSTSSLSQVPSDINKTALVVLSDNRDRFQDYHDFYEFVKGGIGSKRAVPSRSIRNSSWKILFQLAKTAEQLEQVVDLLPRWREMRRTFDAMDSEIFVRRCEELQCAGLALQVFGNHPKYGFDPSYIAALQLLHSLHLSHPLEDTVTASALFKIYNHPSISSSLPACAMLVHACLTHRTDDRAQAVVDALLPALQKLCHDTPVRVGSDPAGLGMRPRFGEKPKVWTRSALIKIRMILKEEGEEYGWLSSAIRKFKRGLTQEFPALQGRERQRR